MTRKTMGAFRVGGVVAARGGIILLEVVISIALLVLALSVLGAQVNRTREAAGAGENLTRLMMLAESKLAELDAGLVRFDEEADNEVEGDFTLRFPHHGWRMRFVETATEGLWGVTLEILYAPRESLDAEFDLDGAEVVYRVHTFWAEPAVLDVETDLGLDEEAVARLSETIPSEYFDPPDFDPSIVTQLDLDQLVELLPSLMTLFGDNADAMLASLPPEFRALLDLGQASDGSTDRGTETGFGDPTGLSEEELNLFNPNSGGGLGPGAISGDRRPANPGRGAGVGGGNRRPPRGGRGPRTGGGRS